MKRYFSHFTYIYPDIYLKNHIVQLDDDNRIISVFPFEKEVEKTEFYSGLLLFLPKQLDKASFSLKTIDKALFQSCYLENNLFTDIPYDAITDREVKIV